ncbi:hypothetical protein NDN08_003289 [Rhodosorus marinus]|uniref:Uncharacterized protein n=1 Tax=Rhodosorus marinus TaxID=101924 RepID=A0AAV8V067_9RHOD|nr:hypothetical protein NDN08_003289 [Rhodosorus marinus]
MPWCKREVREAAFDACEVENGVEFLVRSGSVDMMRLRQRAAVFDDVMDLVSSMLRRMRTFYGFDEVTLLELRRYQAFAKHLGRTLCREASRIQSRWLECLESTLLAPKGVVDKKRGSGSDASIKRISKLHFHLQRLERVQTRIFRVLRRYNSKAAFGSRDTSAIAQDRIETLCIDMSIAAKESCMLSDEQLRYLTRTVSREIESLLRFELCVLAIEENRIPEYTARSSRFFHRRERSVLSITKRVNIRGKSVALKATCDRDPRNSIQIRMKVTNCSSRVLVIGGCALHRQSRKAQIRHFRAELYSEKSTLAIFFKVQGIPYITQAQDTLITAQCLLE